MGDKLGDLKTLVAEDEPFAVTLVATSSSKFDALPQGAVVGRYVTLGKVGEGGMGVVYAAYDPELDRKVALKIIKAVGKPNPSTNTESRTRFIREAKALAQLSHPNVVSVYDVGAYEDSVWLAMEYVDGLTLSRWLGSKTHTWREVPSVDSWSTRARWKMQTAGISICP